MDHLLDLRRRRQDDLRRAAALVYAAWGAAPTAALRLVYACSLVWFVLIFVGIWRAARRYRGPATWTLLARLGVLVGIVRMAAEAALLARL